MTNREKKKDLNTALFDIFSKVTLFAFSVLWIAIKSEIKWNLKTFSFCIGFGLWIVLLISGPAWSTLSLEVASFTGGLNLMIWVHTHLAKWVQICALFSLFLGSWLFYKGIKGWMRIERAQRALDYMGLKTATGLQPKVIGIFPQTKGKTKYLIQATGIDVDSFRQKKGALESAFNTLIQDIRISPSNRQRIEIIATEKDLPTLIRFEDNLDLLKKENTFLVGEKSDGFIVGDLCQLHHVLIAGATGGGKSVFFKMALICLLKTSKQIQLYLLDLKRGVEFGSFETLRNVKVSKDQPSAVGTLQDVVDEMEKRFIYLEKNKRTIIDPRRDPFDRIVVAVDEASVLFFVDKFSKENKVLGLKARDLCDQISKLGRAAAIHLILATQKVVKETIDVRIQTNINAKLCFRVNNIASSMTVLNNKLAADLPKIEGRGIWSVGSEDIEVQVPYLNEKGVSAEILNLKEKFNGQVSLLKQPMLGQKVLRKKNLNLLNVKAQEGDTRQEAKTQDAH